MRIISGKWGGRKIHPPAKMPYTRPTTDVAKEGLFNILQNRMDFEKIYKRSTCLAAQEALATSLPRAAHLPLPSWKRIMLCMIL